MVISIIYKSHGHSNMETRLYIFLSKSLNHPSNATIRGYWPYFHEICDDQLILHSSWLHKKHFTAFLCLKHSFHC